MMRLAAVLIAGLALAGTASAKTYTPKPHHACKAGYVKHLHRKHGRKVVTCVSKLKAPAPKTTAPAPVVTPPPAPATVAPAPALAVSLDPTFTQDPANPLQVTYAYSASASVAGAQATALPAGVLEFYSDGLLECSTNVGAAVTGGSCPVTYTTYGAHVVQTVYSSGTSSATTGPQVETITQPAPVPTSTTLTVTQTGCSVELVQLVSGNWVHSSPPFATDQTDICTYQLTATVSTATAVVAGAASTIVVAGATCGVGSCTAAVVNPSPMPTGTPVACSTWPVTWATATYGGDATHAASTAGDPVELPRDTLPCT